MSQVSGGSRRGLQWTLGVLAAIPVASAAGEIVRGPQGVPGGSPDVIPTVDSSLRYANVFKFAVGPVIWSQLGRVERSSGRVFRGHNHRHRRPRAAVVVATTRAPASHHRGGDRPRDHRRADPACLAAATFCESGVTDAFRTDYRRRQRNRSGDHRTHEPTGLERLRHRSIRPALPGSIACRTCTHRARHHRPRRDRSATRSASRRVERCRQQRRHHRQRAGRGIVLDDLTQQLDINVISQIAVTQTVFPKIATPWTGGVHVLGQWLAHHTGHRRLQRIEVRHRVLGRCAPDGVASMAHSRVADRAWADPNR